MALTNLNALGSAIRTKVGEAEKKTLPQLKDIVDNQLIYPQGELSVTTNGNYDVKSYASVNVATDERTEEDDKNAEKAEFLMGMMSNIATNTTAIWFVKLASPMEVINLEIRFSDLMTDFSDLIYGNSLLTNVTINIDKAENLSQFAQRNSKLEQLNLIGSTQNVTDFSYAFNSAEKLKVINGEMDFSSATNVSNMFAYAELLEEVRFAEGSLRLNIAFTTCTKLSKTSVISALNGLADLSGSAYQTITFDGSIRYDSTDADVKQAIANAIAKNWVVKFGSRTPTGE